MSNGKPTRRQILQAVAAGATALGLAGLVGAQAGLRTPPAPDRARRSVRFAVLSDIHVQDQLRAPAGMAAAFEHANSLKDRPEFIMLGGDSINGGMAARRPSADQMFGFLRNALANHNRLPIEPMLGNHDVWGWNKEASGATGDEAEFGKRWAMDVLGMDKPYRFFDRGPWRFFVLDSTFPQGNGYIARVDDEQMEWFEHHLRRTPFNRHVVVCTHMPIVSVGALVVENPDPTNGFAIPAFIQMTNGPRFFELFKARPNVKLCLSGHTHLYDRADYNGVAYVGCGAVCGAWWRGARDRTEPGYTVFDLYDDGNFDVRYVPWGWKPE